jgi:hypothetical protein
VYYRELLKAVLVDCHNCWTRHRSIPPVFMGFVARRGAEKIIAQIL